jgi:hypothetical protein
MSSSALPEVLGALRGPQTLFFSYQPAVSRLAASPALR